MLGLMLAKITNFGRPRPFPTYKGNFFLGRLQPIETRDRQIVEDFRKQSKRSDVQLKIEILEKEKRVDYSKYRISELRSIASKVGIKGTFTMKKADLIKKLEEKDVTESY